MFSFLGAPVCGTKLVLQQLCFHKPTVVLSHLTRAREILTSNESRVPVTLSILWVLSQPLYKDASVGIKGNCSIAFILFFFLT